jgi:type VI protein secretion system component Hcp
MALLMKLTDPKDPKDKKPKLEGDSEVKEFEKWVEIQSHTIAIGRQVTNHTGATTNRVSGRARMSHLETVQRVDKLAPELFQYAAVGMPLGVVVAHVNQQGDKASAPLQQMFEDALISSFHLDLTTSGGKLTLTWSATKVGIDATVYGPDGKKSDSQKAAYDCALGESR